MTQNRAFLASAEEENRGNREMFAEAERNQEFQKSVIRLQQAVLEGKPLQDPIAELVLLAKRDPNSTEGAGCGRPDFGPFGRKGPRIDSSRGLQIFRLFLLQVIVFRAFHPD